MPARLETLFDRYRHEGSLQALEKVFDATAPALWRIAQHLTPSRDQAEDLLQDTFLAVLERPGDFDATRPLVPWLIGILAMQARRARRLRGRIPDPDRLDRRPHLEASAETVAERRELEHAVRKAVAELPEPYREVLTLHLQEDLAPSQVARQIGRSGNTIRTQIRRGLAMLRGGLPTGLPALAPILSLPRIKDCILAEASAKAAAASSLAGTTTFLGSKLLGGIAMKKVVGMLGCLLLVGSGLWSLVDLSGPPARSQEEEPRAVAGANEQESEDISGSERTRLEPHTREPGATAGTPRRLAQPDFPAGEPREVWIIAAETGKPLPGARISWVCDGPGTGVGTALATETTDAFGKLVRRSGRHAVADAAGIVRLPRLPWPLHVLATSEGRSGSLRLVTDSSPPHQVALHKTRSALIQVVDTEGTPSTGVPVCIVAVTREDRYTAWKGVTAGGEGLTTAHFQVQRQLRGRTEFFAGLGALFGGSEQLRIPLDADASLSSKPIQLTLPPTGRIVVRVHDWQEQQLAEGCVVSIRGSDEASCTRRLEQGRAVLEHVPLGGEFWIEARAEDPALGTRGSCGLSLVSGPAKAGEEREFTVRIGKPFPPLRGRARDEQGRPLTDTLLMSQVLRAKVGGYGLGGGSVVPLTTDADGGFIWRPRIWVDYSKAAALEIQLVHWQDTGRGGDARGPRGTFRAAAPFRDDGMDVGDVRLRAEPLLVTGTVRDNSGASIPDSRVLVDTVFTDNGRPRWRPLARTRTGRDGKYSVSGQATGKLRVRSIKSGYFAGTTRECQPGDQDIDFVMQPSCTVRGRFLLDAGFPTRDLEAVALLGDYDQSGDLARDGSFEIVGVSAGIHSVALRLYDKLLFRMEGVTVRTGEPTVLEPIDLTNRLRLLRLRVLDANGKPPEQVRIGEHGNKGQLLFEASLRNDGHLELPVPVEISRFVVNASEHRAVEIRWRPEKQIVRLQPAFQTRFRWKTPTAAEVPGLKRLGMLSFEWMPLSGESGPAWRSLWQGAFSYGIGEDASGEWLSMAPLPGTGRYQIIWQASPPGSPEPLRIPQAKPQVIEVVESREVQTFDLVLSAADLKRFLKRER